MNKECSSKLGKLGEENRERYPAELQTRQCIEMRREQGEHRLSDVVQERGVGLEEILVQLG